MLTDLQIRNAADVLWRSIDVPPLPMPHIKQSMERRGAKALGSRTPRLSRPALAFAAIVFAALPLLAYSIVSYQTRSRQALEARGGWAPPPPPASLFARLKPKDVTLTQARLGLTFALLPPAGVPSDARLSKIELGAIGLYNRATKAWQLGPNEVVFRYDRGRSQFFNVLIQRYDASDLPGRYIFEDVGPDRKGNPVLIRYDQFAWRNGDQMTQATTSAAINDRAIQEIARAMHGTMLQLRWPNSDAAAGTLHVIR